MTVSSGLFAGEASGKSGLRAGGGGSGVPPAAGGGGDLTTLVAWEHAYYTAGAAFTSEGYSDTDPVTTWPDEVGSVDFVTNSDDPAFDAVDSAFSDHPAVAFAVGDHLHHASALPTGCAGAVLIGRAHVVTAASIENRWHDANLDSGNRYVIGFQNSSYQLFFGGSAAQSVVGNTDPHLWELYQNGASDRLTIDGSNIYTGTDRGTSVLTQMDLGNDGDHRGFSLVFLGLYDGDPASDPGWDDFLAEVLATTGIDAT